MTVTSNNFHPPYGPLQKVLAVLALVAAVVAAFGTFVYAALTFGSKGIFNPNIGTEVHINMVDGKVVDDSALQTLTIPGNPGGYAEPNTTWMLHGDEPLSQTASYLAIAEAGQVALMVSIILLLAVGAILVLANRSIVSFTRIGVLAVGILAVIVSVLVPFFQRESAQATLRELGIQPETDQTVIIAEFFDFSNINFLMMGLGLVLIFVAFLIPRYRTLQTVLPQEPAEMAMH